MDGELQPSAATERESGRRVFGILLIVAGAALLLDRLHLPEPFHLHDGWPLLVIALGVVRFWSHRRSRRRGAGLGIITAGIVALLHTQNVVSLEDSWPLVVVGAGVSILVSAWSAGSLPAEGGRP